MRKNKRFKIAVAILVALFSSIFISVLLDFFENKESTYFYISIISLAILFPILTRWVNEAPFGSNRDRKK